MTDGASAAGAKVTAALLIIGNEILSGRTQDTNLKTLAVWLNERGVRLAEARVVPDVEAGVVGAVNELRAKHAYLFTTGGIGPTHDDITSACVAKALGVPLTRHPEAERRLLDYYPPEKRTDARMKMADTPEGAELIDNPISTAPGFKAGNVFVLAGVPKIMRAMLDFVEPHIQGGRKVFSRTLVVYAGEGEIAATLTAMDARYVNVDIGSYPFFKLGAAGAAVVFRSEDEDELERAVIELEREFEAAGVSTERRAEESAA